MKSLSVFIFSAAFLIAGYAHANCRLDWNGDGVINTRDVIHHNPNPPEGECGSSGFYVEWYMYMYYPEEYEACFPDGDPGTLDFNGDGTIDGSDYVGDLVVDAETEGFYAEWYIYNSYIDYWPIFMPEYNCDQWYRGDPTTFPQDNLPNCEEACALADACGSATHPVYPLDLEFCESICDKYRTWTGEEYYALARSYEFRTCVMQETCEEVKGCGGWLWRETVSSNICPAFCEHSFSPIFLSPHEYEYASPVNMNSTPPKGFKFSKSRLLVKNRGRSVDYAANFGATVKRAGRHNLLSFDEPVSREVLEEIARDQEVLPTFEQTSGHLAAAAPTVFVKIAKGPAFARVRDKVRSRGRGVPKRTRANTDLYRVDAVDGWDALEIYNDLSTIDGAHVELDLVREYDWHMTPDDPQYGEQWHLQNDGPSDMHLAGVDGRVSEAWDITTGSDTIVLGILDSGVDLNHPDLMDKLETPYNYPVDWQDQIAVGFGDHGTAVAGVAAAIGNNGIGVSGVCQNCKILPAVLGEPSGNSFYVSDAEIAETFDHLVDVAKVDVINNSWGPGQSNPFTNYNEVVFEPLPAIIADAFDNAKNTGRDNKGTVIVWSAGNNNSDIVGHPFCSHDAVVCVSAVDDQGLKSYYSSFGAAVDIAAPTSGGNGSITTTRIQAEPRDGSDYRNDFGGTSSAAPFITGVVGLMLSANSDLTADEVAYMLSGAGRKIDKLGGAWSADFTHSPFYGAGLIDTYAAVMLATGDCDGSSPCIAPSDLCEGDCERLPCDACRTDLDCALDHVCHPLPDLGISSCVAAAPVEGCPVGFEEQYGYCLPQRDYCGECLAQETAFCNQRDENCDGYHWTMEECEDITSLHLLPRCYGSDADCDMMEMGEDAVCIATHCFEGCTTDEDCPFLAFCEPAKNRYGDMIPDRNICVEDQQRWIHDGYPGLCEGHCPVVMPTLTDQEFNSFQDCVEDGIPECDPTNGCLQECHHILSESISLEE